ncbi:type II toxin-antitoxin system HicA family toxin [Pseudanabaena sp. PCC 6802]|uniref:type II toxin-antitoxin system HicA family toxin n=1 Tax=Pseudanabaena sp. PCC 6802 TaxID=118173 RepID=UPI0021F12793|nr:type II toxin-antitoxin system HicA family toxin [Pseudanabaena sp. PCC 6802]
MVVITLVILRFCITQIIITRAFLHSQTTSYTQIIAALERDGWVAVRQRGSHIRLEKELPEQTIKLTIPSHRSVKRSTLAHILKQARVDIDKFLNLL